jgi:hypothetical protein
VANSGDYQKPAQDPDDRLKALEQHMTLISTAVNNLSGMATVENVLVNGFKRLGDTLAPLGGLQAQLAPLRDLSPPREPLPGPSAQALTSVLSAMKRPSLSGIGSLGLGEANVPFIGQPGVAVPTTGLTQTLVVAFPPPGQVGAYPPLIGAPERPALGGGIQP